MKLGFKGAAATLGWSVLLLRSSTAFDVSMDNDGNYSLVYVFSFNLLTRVRFNKISGQHNRLWLDKILYRQ